MHFFHITFSCNTDNCILELRMGVWIHIIPTNGSYVIYLTCRNNILHFLYSKISYIYSIYIYIYVNCTFLLFSNYILKLNSEMKHGNAELDEMFQYRVEPKWILKRNWQQWLKWQWGRTHFFMNWGQSCKPNTPYSNWRTKIISVRSRFSCWGITASSLIFGKKRDQYNVRLHGS